MTIIRKIVTWFKLIFVFATRDDLPRGNRAPVMRRTRADANEIEDSGRWYFRHNILDNLDGYFWAMNRLKKADRNAYDLFGKVGAQLLSKGNFLATEEFPTYAVDNIPAFGAVVLMTGRDDSDTSFPRMLYFRKCENPYFIEPFNGPVFELSLFFCDDISKKKKYELAFPCYVGVNGQTVKLLRYKTDATQRILHKDKRHGSVSYVHQSKWTYGWPEYKEFNGPRKDMYLTAEMMFKIAVSGIVESASGVRVTVKKNKLRCVFAIDMLRTPYFFSDREPVYIAGKKKRIFHIVRTHKRISADGKESIVRSHCKGLRHFAWNGYRVVVSLAGLHHPDIMDIKDGFYDFGPDEPTPGGMMSNKDFAKAASKILEAA